MELRPPLQRWVLGTIPGGFCLSSGYYENTVDSVSRTIHLFLFLILLEFETSKVKVLANLIPVL